MFASCAMGASVKEMDGWGPLALSAFRSLREAKIGEQDIEENEIYQENSYQ